jgi:hypothetical protein
MNMSEFEVLGFNLGGLFVVLPLIAFLAVLFWQISLPSHKSGTED